MNSEPRRGSRKGTQLAHPGAPCPILGWVVAASEARVTKTLARGVKTRSLLSQAKGHRQQLSVSISEATMAQRATCPRSHSRQIRLRRGSGAPGQDFFCDTPILSQLWLIPCRPRESKAGHPSPPSPPPHSPQEPGNPMAGEAVMPAFPSLLPSPALELWF